MKHLYKSCSKLYSVVVMWDLCLCEMQIKAVHVYVYNYAFIKLVSSGTKTLTLKYFVVKKFSVDTPRDENILPQAIFTRKYPTVNFSQTTVLDIWYCSHKLLSLLHIVKGVGFCFWPIIYRTLKVHCSDLKQHKMSCIFARTF